MPRQFLITAGLARDVDAVERSRLEQIRASCPRGHAAISELLHEGVVTIASRAPDALVFTRDGEPLVDARAPAELRVAASLRDEDRGTRACRYQEVVTLEHAKQALEQLGYKRRAARRAIEEARAHVGTDADVQTLVKTVLALEKQRTGDDDEGDRGIEALARQALVQSGFSPGVASRRWRRREPISMRRPISRP